MPFPAGSFKLSYHRTNSLNIMTIKNISGKTLTLSFGRYTHTVASNGTLTLAEDPKTIANVSDYFSRGLIQVVKGPAISDFGNAAVTPSHILVHVKNAGTDGDYLTFTLPGKSPQIFELNSNGALTIADATSVTIGANAGATAANLKTAFNANTVLTAAGFEADEVVNHTTGTVESWVLVKATGNVAATAVTVESSVPARFAVSTVAANTNETLGQQIIYVPAVNGTTLLVKTGFTTIVHYAVTTLNADGSPLSYNGTISKTGGCLFFDDDSTTDLASTSQVIVIAYGR